jgi:Na+-translocating ferredoxin:NAD+ oxidoreductase RnfD subunit
MPGELPRLHHYFNRSARQREVEEELQFHVEMQVADYERDGMSHEEALLKAKQRFGDFARIRSECIQINLHGGTGMWVQKILFITAFVLGVFVRSLDYGRPVTRMGDVLIMIAVFGGLLVMGKKMRLRHFGAASPPLRLELQSSSAMPPPAFDENGRTPFERVTTDP